MIFLFDCDRTLFNITGPTGKQVCARDTEPCWKYSGIIDDQEKWIDSHGNLCVLERNLRKLLRKLDNGQNQIHAITHSMKYDFPLNQQPVFELLKQTGLRKYFSTIVAMSGKKSKWADSLTNGEKFFFIDDEPENINDVKNLVNSACLYPEDFFGDIENVL